ncbi:terminase [Staphylococcus coagulans]|uniref:phage tail protein n=1 Tax=Staphylococcus coagulans TaxID=74706 RepID=UPI0030EDBC9D
MEKNFYARINAILKDFERGVRKAQRLAKTSVPNEIETEIKANTSKFQRALTRAKAMAQKWREHTVEIDGDASPLKRVITMTKAILKTFRKHTVKIDANVNNFDLIKAKLVDVWHAGGRSLDDFSERIDHLASRIRSFGTVFAQQIKGVMIASVQALIPVIAGLVPALFAVLNAVGVLGGGVIGLAGAFSVAGLGAVAFGAMAISAIKMFNDGLIQSTDATDAYEKSLEGLKNTWSDIIKLNADSIFGAMSSGLNGLQTALKNLTPFLSGVSMLVDASAQQFEKWVAKSNTAKKAFKALNSVGVQIFADLLNAAGRFGDGLVNIFTQFFPLFKFMSQGLQNMSIDFQNWANSVNGQNAIKSFIEYTKTNLPKIGKIFGNVFKGIGNLMIAFGQNSAGIFNWLVQMTNKFREWSETVGKSEGFKKFVKYVEQNGPVIMKLIGDIVRILVAFGKAMAPIASGLLKLIGKIAEFTAALFENHPNVARFFGILTILGGAFWALLAPIIFVSTVISNVFGKSLFDVIKYIIKFTRASTILKGAFGLLKGAIGLLLNPIGNLMKILPVLGGAIAGISFPIWVTIGVIIALAGFIVYLWKTNDKFREAIINAWETIKNSVGNAIEGLKKWFDDLSGKMQGTLEPIMPLLEKVGEVFNEVLGNVFVAVIQAVITAVQGLWTVIQVIFQAIGTVVSVNLQLMVGALTAFIQFLSGDFSGAWETLKNTIANVGETIWQGIQSIWNTISQFLLDTYNRITGQTASSWSEVWQTIQNYAIAIWNVVVQWFQEVANTVLTKMLTAYNYIVQKGLDWVNAIRQAMINFINTVVQKFWEVVNECRNGMQNALNAVRSFIGDFVQAGIDIIGGLISGIVQKAKDLAQAAWNAAKGALNAAKSALDSHSPSREFMQLGRDSMTGLGMGINQFASKAAKESKNAALKVMDAFDANLVPTFDTGAMSKSLTSDISGLIDGDIRHELQENNRPVVNVMVKNESDLPAIKSYIDEVNGKDAAFSVF